MAGDLAKIRFRPQFGCVECNQAGVVVVGTVYRAGAETGHEADHAGLHVDARVPAIGIYRQANAGGMWMEIGASRCPGHPHDQHRHLFVFGQQAAPFAVAQCLLAHGAGIDPTHGIQQALQALFPRPSVGAKHAVVLTGKGIAIAVLQSRTGAHDERPFAEIFEHSFELAHHRW